MQLRADPEWFTSTGHSPILVSALNDTLPSDVRVTSACLVTQGFNARNDVLSRSYHYWLPVTALFPGDASLASIDDESIQKELRRFRQTFSSFVGMHNFHNFTQARVRNAFVRPLNPALMRPHPFFADTTTSTSASGGQLEQSDFDARSVENFHLENNELISPMAENLYTQGIAESRISCDSGNSRFAQLYSILLADRMRESVMRPTSITEADPALTQSRNRAQLPPGHALAWAYAPQVSRTVFHADVSEPFELVTDDSTAPPALQLRGNAPPLDSGFVFLRGEKANKRSIASSPVGTLLRPGAGSRMIRLSLHGSGFMPRQIRCMVGTSLAVHWGVLSADIMRAALVLPYCPAVPMAPPGGLVQVRCVEGA